ncbi:HI0074 family nucleotidyltransferase substrate-binding subunit [Sandaracinobacteroides saxicola]|uniref:Nucleotidyltransferase substrate binding protein n=1 Tax=Sandaracinobacteroides saxicola TaxID=2759707 RepID=A0A7G5IJ80_9SPHN|nr:HI0074 family nucleotidyltransferase substrate-binding subunit [Sandaracinobacteroides saxicola]QMW23422.1 nucleotidyltransferase substrate binding protein [Sandaracinobacteroides saxicola]
MAQPDLPRWATRFDNYSRAYDLLCEALDRDRLNPLEQEGTIQRFEYSWQLAWSLLADDLTEQGIPLEPRTPAATIRAAAAAGLIHDASIWMEALNARNKLSHVYDARLFEAAIADLRTRYRPLFEALHSHYAARRQGLSS